MTITFSVPKPGDEANSNYGSATSKLYPAAVSAPQSDTNAPAKVPTPMTSAPTVNIPIIVNQSHSAPIIPAPTAAPSPVGTDDRASPLASPMGSPKPIGMAPMVSFTDSVYAKCANSAPKANPKLKPKPTTTVTIAIAKPATTAPVVPLAATMTGTFDPTKAVIKNDPVKQRAIDYEKKAIDAQNCLAKAKEAEEKVIRSIAEREMEAAQHMLRVDEALEQKRKLLNRMIKAAELAEQKQAEMKREYKETKEKLDKLRKKIKSGESFIKSETEKESKKDKSKSSKKKDDVAEEKKTEEKKKEAPPAAAAPVVEKKVEPKEPDVEMDPEKEKVVAKPASAVEKKDEKKTQEAKTTAKKRPRSRSGDKDREAKKLASKRKSVEAAMESSSSSSSSGSDSSDSSDDEDCGRFVLGHCRPRPMPMPRLPSSATGIARKKPPRDRNARPNLKRSNFTTGPRMLSPAEQIARDKMLADAQTFAKRPGQQQQQQQRPEMMAGRTFIAQPHHIGPHVENHPMAQNNDMFPNHNMAQNQMQMHPAPRPPMMADRLGNTRQMEDPARAAAVHHHQQQQQHPGRAPASHPWQ